MLNNMRTLGQYLVELNMASISDDTRNALRIDLEANGDVDDHVSVSNNIINVVVLRYRSGAIDLDTAFNIMKDEMRALKLSYYDMDIEPSVLRTILENTTQSDEDTVRAELIACYNAIKTAPNESKIRTAFLYAYLSQLVSVSINHYDMDIIAEITVLLDGVQVNNALKRTVDMIRDVTDPTVK